MLKEAERLRVRKFKRPDNPDTYEKEKKRKLDYLDPRIIKYEEKAFFDFKEMDKFEGGDFETILTEAEI